MNSNIHTICCRCSLPCDSMPNTLSCSVVIAIDNASHSFNIPLVKTTDANCRYKVDTSAVAICDPYPHTFTDTSHPNVEHNTTTICGTTDVIFAVEPELQLVNSQCYQVAVTVRIISNNSCVAQYDSGPTIGGYSNLHYVTLSNLSFKKSAADTFNIIATWPAGAIIAPQTTLLSGSYGSTELAAASPAFALCGGVSGATSYTQDLYNTTVQFKCRSPLTGKSTKQHWKQTYLLPNDPDTSKCVYAYDKDTNSNIRYANILNMTATTTDTSVIGGIVGSPTPATWNVDNPPNVTYNVTNGNYLSYNSVFGDLSTYFRTVSLSNTQLVQKPYPPAGSWGKITPPPIGGQIPDYAPGGEYSLPSLIDVFPRVGISYASTPSADTRASFLYLHGNGFKNRLSRVTIGGSVVTELIIVNDNLATCRCPIFTTSGTKNIRLFYKEYWVASDTGHVLTPTTYTMFSVSQTHSTVKQVYKIEYDKPDSTGGTWLCIEGTNLGSVTSCRIDNVDALLYLVVSDTFVKGYFPSFTTTVFDAYFVLYEGVNIVFTSNRIILNKTQLTITAAPHADSSTCLTWQGTGFTTLKSVTFNGLEAARIQIIGDTQLNIYPPYLAPNTVATIVFTNEYGTLGTTFTFDHLRIQDTGNIRQARAGENLYLRKMAYQNTSGATVSLDLTGLTTTPLTGSDELQCLIPSSKRNANGSMLKVTKNGDTFQQASYFFETGYTAIVAGTKEYKIEITSCVIS